MFQVDRIQYPIGQGGFHATAIHRYDGKKFSMVVDCGGSDVAHRQNLINVFSEHGGEHDILAISHFDSDHIDGIAQLGKSGIRFKFVFLPHLDVATYLRWMTLRLVSGLTGSIEISEILKTAGEIYGGVYGQVVKVGSRPADPDNFDDDLSSGEDLLELLDRSSKSKVLAAGAGNIYSHSQSLSFSELDWIVRFYSREWENPQEAGMIWSLAPFAKLKSLFERAAKQNSKQDWIDFSENLTKELEADVSAVEYGNAWKNLIQSLKSANLKTPSSTGSKKKISCKGLLSEMYLKISALKDYNDASMCVYSGPTQRNPSSIPRGLFSRSVHMGSRSLQMPLLKKEFSRHVGWINTGDADFSTVEKLNDFLEHYHAEMRLTSAFVLPHHGSKKSYDDRMMRLKDLIAELCDRPLLIAPADPEHKTYQHPHWVVEATCRIACDFHIVNKNRTSTYDESIYYGPYWRY